MKKKLSLCYLSILLLQLQISDLKSSSLLLLLLQPWLCRLKIVLIDQAIMWDIMVGCFKERLLLS
jgi:hypothetical protein